MDIGNAIETLRNTHCFTPESVSDSSLVSCTGNVQSPIESIFLWHISKYVSGKIETQVEVPTKCANYFVDFIIHRECGGPIGFECDGKEFHDAHRDEWRDALILSSSDIKRIYRLPGTFVFHHIDDCLYLISQRESALFSERGLINLKTLASDEAKQATTLNGETKVIYGDRHMYMVCHSLRDSFLKQIAHFCQSHPACTLEKLQREFAAYQSLVGTSDVPRKS